MLEILQQTRLLVFAFTSFLNQDRLGVEISYCFKKIYIYSSAMLKEFNLMYTLFTKTDLETREFAVIFFSIDTYFIV